MNCHALAPVIYFWLSFIGLVGGLLFVNGYIDQMPVRARIKLLLAIARVAGRFRAWCSWALFEIHYLWGRCRKATRRMNVSDNRPHPLQTLKRRTV
jgi:hypothetical protein